MFRHTWVAAVVLAVLLAEGRKLGAQETATRPDRSKNSAADAHSEERERNLAERDRLWDEATQAKSKGDLAKAAAFGEQMLALERVLFGDDDEEVTSSLAWLAEVYEAAGKLPAAEVKLRDVLRRRTEEWGDKHWRVTDARLALEHCQWLSAQTPAKREQVGEAVRLNSDVMDMIEAGQSRQAVDAASRALALRTELLGAEHPHTAISLNNLGTIYKDLGDYAKAEPLIRRASDIWKGVLGEEHPYFAASVNNLAVVYDNMGDYAKAEATYQRVRDTLKRVHGEKHENYAAVLSNLAELYRELGRYTKAEPLYRKAIEIEAEILGEDDPSYAASLKCLAHLYTQTSDFEKAEPLYQQSLSILKCAFGEEHPGYATSLHGLASLYTLQGKYEQAESLYRKALGILKAIYGEEHASYGYTVGHLAIVYSYMGDYAQAEKLYREHLGILKKVFGEKHPHYAAGLNNLAALYREWGKYTQAKTLLLQARDIWETATDGKHPKYAGCLHDLASLAESLGDYTQAEQLCQQALEIRRKVHGEEHPAYARSLRILAHIQKERGDYAKAGLLYKTALDIQRKALGEEHPVCASSLGNLAILYENQGDYEDAEPLCRQAIEIEKKALGEEHPSYASSLNTLACILHGMGDYERAEPLYQKALAIKEKALGEDNPDCVVSLHNLATFYASMRDYSKAEPLLRRALEVSRDWLENAALVLSERQQLAMNRSLRYRLHSYLSIALESGQFHIPAARETLRWKGATLVRQRAMRLAADDPAIADRFQQLQQLTRQLAVLSHSRPKQALDARRERLVKLTARKEMLEGQLRRDSLAFRGAARDITLEQIQKALPNDGVLVDYLQYSRYRFVKETGDWVGEASLIAVVLPRRGEPRLIDLGPVAPVSAAIDSWRRTFGMSSSAVAAGRELRRLAWEPLLEYVDKAKTVVVSTDGELGRLPLGALPGRAPDTFLLEDHRLAFVPVPQLIPELVAKAEPRGGLHRLLLVGDVDFGLNAGGQPRPWISLRGTAREIDALDELYRGQAAHDGRIVTLRQRDASEAQVREQLVLCSVNHLATHGLFESHQQRLDRPLSPFSRGPATDRTSSNVMLSRFGEEQQTVTVVRSGLVLAGANQSSGTQGTSAEGSIADDGLLMADEILLLPLQNAELVVLSACDTGQGLQHSGEGLLGLQRSFQVAGVRTTVASLWKVDDLATQLLMQRFHRNMVEKNLSRLESLQEAQLWLLRSGRQVLRESARRAVARGDRGAEPVVEELDELETAYLPPYYWAGFILSGDWR